MLFRSIMDKLLKPSLTMGVVDAASIKPEHIAQPEKKKPPAPKPKRQSETEEEAAGVVAEFVKPSLAAMLNTFDFESVARETMEPQAWGYYSSGGDDEITLRDNHLAFQRIVMRPRVLVNVRDIDMTTTLLGVPAALPLYFTATALAKPISCVTQTIVIPSLASSTIVSKTSDTISGSSADVGSSNNITFGFIQSDRAMATRCC